MAAANAVEFGAGPASVAVEQAHGDLASLQARQQSRPATAFEDVQADLQALFGVLQDDLPRCPGGAAPAGQAGLVRTGLGAGLVEQGGGQGQFLGARLARLQAGVFGDSCKTYGMSSWACGVLPNLAVWASNTFVYFIEYPFTYDASDDWIGASSALMWTGSPIAYFFATVATNYWVWKLNQL